jgi:hypothetical protein
MRQEDGLGAPGRVWPVHAWLVGMAQSSEMDERRRRVTM